MQSLNGSHAARFTGAGILLLVVSGCGSGSDRPPPAGRVLAATDRGVLESNPAILGRDVVHSGMYQGASVWLYGDTFLASPDAQRRTLISSSWSSTTDLDATDGITGFLEPLDRVAAPVQLLPETEAESAFNAAHRSDACTSEPCGARWALWPASMVEDSERERALVFYSLVYAQPGAYNFRAVGRSIAVWDEFDQPLERPLIDPIADYPTLMFADFETPFGSAAFVNGETLYAYGCQLVELEKPCGLARVPLAQVFTRREWQYFAGDGWSSNIDATKTLFDGNDILSVSWNAYLGSYAAVYSRPFTNSVVMRTALAPEGPWSSEVVLFEAQAPSSTDTIYDAQAHAEYEIDGGRIVFVTYSRGTGANTSEVRLMSVELQRREP